MFIKGMDISSHMEMMDRGHKYYDFDGNEVDILDFGKAQGFNYARLRIWNNPENVKESGGYCNLEYTKQMAKEIKSRDLGFLLDFHYSDYWADPGQQNKPLEWKDLTGKALEDAVYDYTKSVLAALDENGTYPDMVQVGNEIRCGMLWPDGLTSNWDGLAGLLNAGIRAVRETQKGRDTKIMLHLDQGGRFYYFREWFDNALAHGVTDFDIIGLSYYPFWHGTFNDLKNSMENLAGRYKRPLIVAEMAHAYRRSRDNMFGEEQERISGFPAGGAAQKQVLELIMSIAAHVSNGMGMGVFYWEPFIRPSDENEDGWGYCMGVVDSEGMPTLGLKAFNTDIMGIDVNKTAKIYAPSDIEIPKGSDISEYLPKTIRTLKYDGRLEREEVIWEPAPAMNKSDTCVINGKLSESGEMIELKASFVEKDSQSNLLANADLENIFKGLPENWNIEQDAESGSLNLEMRQEVSEIPPIIPVNYIYFKAESNFKLSVSQKTAKLSKGAYSFSVYYQGDNTTNVKAGIYVKNEQGETLGSKEIFPSADGWTKYSAEFTLEKDSAVTVAVIIDAPAIYGMIKQPSLIPANQQ